MDDDVAAWKLVAVYLVWLLAAAAMALVAVLLLGTIASLFGADSQSDVYRRMTEIGAVVVFIILAATPFLVRRKMSGESEETRDG